MHRVSTSNYRIGQISWLVCLITMSICLTLTASQFISKSPRTGSRWFVYQLLRSEPDILTSRLLYHRIPVQHVGSRLDPALDIVGRHLFLFEREEGENNVWWDLSPEQKVRTYFSNLFYSIQFNFANLL